MFKELAPMLKKGDLLALTIGLEADGKLRVNVMPRLFTLDGEHGADRKALNTPVTITGTAEELDSPEFPAQLTRFTASVNDTRHTIDEAEAAHKTAAETKKAKNAPAKGKTETKTGKEETKPVKTETPAAAEPSAETATEPLI